MIVAVRYLRFLPIIGGVLLFLLLAGGTAAQSNDKSKAITIEPFLQEVILEPGDSSKIFSVRITNNTRSIFNFELEPLDFGSLNETGGIFFTGTEGVKLSSKYGLAEWIELEHTGMSLPAGGTAKINVTIYNRPDLSPGGHYGAIFINSTGESAQVNKPRVSLRQSISALILAVKRGGERYDMALAGLETNGSWYKPPSRVSLRFKNTGNTHVVPRGIVSLADEKKTIYLKGVINEDSSYILPETYRILPVELKSQKGYSLGLIRSYKLNVDYRYDDLDKIATKSYTVRWVNWPMVIVLIVILTAAFFTVNYYYGDKIAKYRKTTIKNWRFKKLFRD